FRAALSLTIPGDANPIPALDKLDAHFQRLETNKFTVSEHVKGMILMAKLPASMDSMIQVYLSGLKPTQAKTAIETITIADVRQAAILQWEQRQGRHGGQRANANKLSAVRRKGPDPTFRQQQQRPQKPQQQQQQQQRPQGQQQQQQGRPRGGRSRRGRRQHPGAHQHAQFAHVADAAPPAADLGVPPTFERVRTLEGIFQQKPATRSKNSLFSSSESSSRSPSPFEDDETYHRSVSEAIPSRSPSPSGSTAAASHSAKRTHKQRSVVNISDSEEDKSTPVVKRKRTLRERMTLPLTARISDPMDVDDREDAVSLGISECEQEVDD
ncbi:hypothetical protein C8Q76DRAFT_595716, partial [Earliella scabrosa]